MTYNGHVVTFNGEKCTISKHDEVITIGYRHENLYALNTSDTQAEFSCTPVALKASLDLWYQRLGNVHVEGIRSLVPKKVVTGLEIDPNEKTSTCSACHSGKLTRAPIPKHGGLEAKLFSNLSILTYVGSFPWNRSEDQIIL